MGGHWQVFYPELFDQLMEEYWYAVELIDSEPKKAEKLLKKVITATNGLHFDAVQYLGYLYNENGKTIEGNALIHKAHQIALKAIPDGFNPTEEEILWLHINNRPFLRSFHSVGLELMNEGRLDEAIDKFFFLIMVNPNDNQGIRYLIIDCYSQLGRFEDFFKIDELYPDDYSVDFLYGKALALFKTNQPYKAKKQLATAAKMFPYVLEELKKAKHVFPADEFDRPLDGIPIGSRQEAFDYWRRMGKFWKGIENL